LWTNGKAVENRGTSHQRYRNLGTNVTCKTKSYYKVFILTLAEPKSRLTIENVTYHQGCKEVRWRPGQEVSLAPPCSNLRSYGTNCTVVKKVLATLLRLFGALTVIRRPHSDSAPGELCPSWPPSLRPCLSWLNVS